MSNQVYGYALLDGEGCSEDFAARAGDTALRLGLGFSEIRDTELFNFPSSIAQTTMHFSFRITDGPGKNTASYLVDFENYAPEAEIGLPRNGRRRLGLLLDWLSRTLSIPFVTGVAVAVTDCDEIEEVLEVPSGSIEAQLVADMADYAPPNKLYIIRVPEHNRESSSPNP